MPCQSACQQSHRACGASSTIASSSRKKTNSCNDRKMLPARRSTIKPELTSGQLSSLMEVNEKTCTCFTSIINMLSLEDRSPTNECLLIYSPDYMQVRRIHFPLHIHAHNSVLNIYYAVFSLYFSHISWYICK